MSRVIDDQKEKIEKFSHLYEKFKKENSERRTKERQEKYDKDRTSLWLEIEENHRILTEAGAPAEYHEKFKNACEINAKFFEKLKTWTKFEFKPTLALRAEREEASQGLSKSPLPSTSIFPPSNLATVPEIPNPITFPDVSNFPTSATSQAPIMSTYESNFSSHQIGNEIPMPEGLSWNQQIEQSSNIERILMMLAQNQISQNSMKPPELHIRNFDGKANEYISFKNTFARSIKNTNWEQVDLFIFLKSHLSGNAFKAIASLETSEQSYSLAWTILERRFFNKRKLLEATMSLLTDDSFRTELGQVDSINSFVNVYQSVRANVKQIQATTDEIIMDFVLSRIDDVTRGRFEDFIGKSTTTPSFEQLDDFFEKETRVYRKNQSNPGNAQKAKQQQSRTYVTQDGKGQLECFLCSKNHVATECDVFLGNEDREKLLRRNHVCIYCVSHRYDRNQPCKKKRFLKCDKCQGQHITLNHRISNNAGENQQQNNVFLTKDVSSKISILPTAVADVLSSNGSYHPVRCLVDLCAERSYICEDLVQKFHLKKIKTKVTIAGINGITGKSFVYVKLVIKIDDELGDIITEALVVPKVTGMLPAIKDEHLLSHLNVKLADLLFYKPSFVGILLGSDVSTKLFKEEPNKITSEGLLLQPTRLGWIVSGTTSKPSDFVSTFVTISETCSKALSDQDIARKNLDFHEVPEPDDEETKTTAELCEKIYKEKSLHAVSRLSPRFPENEEDQITKRQTRSTGSKTISAINICLLVLLCLSPNVKANPEVQTLEQLQPGVHLRSMGQISRKAFDIDFKVTTNLNITHDLIIVKASLSDFNIQCQKFIELNKNVTQQCQTLNSSISKLTAEITNDLTTSYQHQREKRWFQITAKTLWKAAPVVVSTAGMIYQEVQITKLQNELRSTKEKVRKTVNAILKTNDLEYEGIEQKLNEVILHQNKLQILEIISEFAQETTLLLKHIKYKHDNVINIKPTEELNKFIASLLRGMNDIELPTDNENIFNIYAPQKKILNDMVIIMFKIPLIMKPALHHWVIISVPSEEGELVLLSNNNKYQRILVHPKTEKFSDITEHQLVHPAFIDNIILTAMDECTSDIVNNKSSVRCHKDNIDRKHEEIVPIYDTIAAIFTKQGEKPTIQCANENISIKLPAAIFDTDLCNVDTNFRVNVAEEMEEIVSPMTFEKLEDITPNPNVSAIRESITTSWNNLEDLQTKSAVGIVLIISGIMIIFTIVYRRTTRRDVNWLPQWEGPLREI